MKIAVVGTHCAGKSTLVDNISTYFDLPKIEEVASKYGKSDRPDVITQITILDRQMNEERCHDNFVSDRSVFDNMAYLSYYSRNLGGDGELSRFATMLAAISHLKDNPYDYMVFVDEYFPLVDDGNRDMDSEIQEWVYTWIKDRIYYFSDIVRIPVIRVYGTTDNRILSIVERLTLDRKL